MMRGGMMLKTKGMVIKMEICPIGNGNFYIEISGDELQGGDVTEIVKKNVTSLPEDTLLEVFPGGDGALVFARTRRGNPIVFSFPGIEALIVAVGECECDCMTFLAHDGGEYLLIYYPWGSEPAPASLYEFCTDVKETHNDFPRHIKEHGKLLLGPYAIEALRQFFW